LCRNKKGELKFAPTFSSSPIDTYEGTNDIHKLVIGERITGIAAFV